MAPFSDTYEPMKDIDIALAATGFTSVNGRQYILVFYEALYILELDHNLINTNQFRQLHTQVQNNLYHATETMSISNLSGYFTACLEYQGINIFLNT